MNRGLVAFLRDESGATAIEYALILGLVVLAIVGSLGLLGTSIDGMYSYVSSSVSSTVAGGG